MMQIHLIFADTLFQAWFQDTPTDGHKVLWNGHCVDLPSGTRQEFHGWTEEQMGAVVALITTDTWSPDMTKWLYETAEPLVKDWPRECRPIP